MAHLRGKRNLTTEKKACIVGMVDAGMSHAKVGKAVGLGRTTITEIFKQSKACGTVKTAKKSGRPCLNTDCNLRQLQQVLQDNQKSTLAKVTNSLSVAFSTSTVQRRAHEMGFNNQVAVKKPFANNINQQKRLAFARKHINWNVADWSIVIWLDESSFEIGKKSKQVKVWREKKTK
jgi:transposase